MILCKWVICDVRIFPISIDRTFLLISRDPSGVSVGNMPYHLVVRGYDRGTHLLEFAGSILQDEQRH